MPTDKADDVRRLIERRAATAPALDEDDEDLDEADLHEAEQDRLRPL